MDFIQVRITKFQRYSLIKKVNKHITFKKIIYDKYIVQLTQIKTKLEKKNMFSIDWNILLDIYFVCYIIKYRKIRYYFKNNSVNVQLKSNIKCIEYFSIHFTLNPHNIHLPA